MLSLQTVISSIWHHYDLQLEQFNRDNNSYCLSNSFCLSPALVIAKPFLAKGRSRAGTSELVLSLLYFHQHRYFDFDQFVYLCLILIIRFNVFCVMVSSLEHYCMSLLDYSNVLYVTILDKHPEATKCIDSNHPGCSYVTFPLWECGQLASGCKSKCQKIE